MSRGLGDVYKRQFEELLYGEGLQRWPVLIEHGAIGVAAQSIGAERYGIAQYHAVGFGPLCDCERKREFEDAHHGEFVMTIDRDGVLVVDYGDADTRILAGDIFLQPRLKSARGGGAGRASVKGRMKCKGEEDEDVRKVFAGCSHWRG